MISSVVDPARQTVPIRVLVANRDGFLKPNAFVEAHFRTRHRGRVLRVPSRAVVTDGLDSVVFVEDTSGAYEWRKVTVGRRDTEWAEILGGLKPGERVVSRGALLLLNAVDLQR